MTNKPTNTRTGIKSPLAVRDLWVEYAVERGVVKAVRGISLDLREGESLALIGESGCGKTTLGLSLVRLLVKAATIRRGEINYLYRDGREIDVRQLREKELQKFRWQECAMAFQSALNALNPVLTILDQFHDTFRSHGHKVTKSYTRQRAKELLREVQLDPDRVINSYPHELSGGMRQRVLLAMSLLLDPQVIILDEPTTALDILTQRTIIDLLHKLQNKLNFSMIFISHDLSTAAELADRMATMYAGTIVELGSVDDTFYHPAHPYTLGLIQAVPTITGDFEELSSIPGAPPDLIDPPSGCKFHPRCPYATERCRREEPKLVPVGGDVEHTAACFYAERVSAAASVMWQERHADAAGED